MLARRLERFVPLSVSERAALSNWPQRVRRLAARSDLVREGEPPGDPRLILAGWACRYKMLADGRRQIVGLVLPGDLCEPDAGDLEEMDHSLGALTEVRFVEIPQDQLDSLSAAHPRIARALRRYAVSIAAVQREWIVSLGQRTAFERIGHLLCEIFHRLNEVGQCDGDRCEMPITQTDLADAAGITPVHVNRTLQELRSLGLIALKGRVLTIPDLARLEEAVLFSPGYLGARRRGRAGETTAAAWL